MEQDWSVGTLHKHKEQIREGGFWETKSPFFWEEKENKSVTENEGEWRLTFLDTLTWVYLPPQSTVTFYDTTWGRETGQSAMVWRREEDTR